MPLLLRCIGDFSILANHSLCCMYNLQHCLQLCGIAICQFLYKELQEKCSALQSQLNESQLRAEIDKERAVMDKEREMQDRLREADKENAKLQAKIEQLSAAETSPK